jgi:hypothetical protein
MTNCCNDFGNCTQGRDCPIRKQRAQEANEAFIKLHRGADDPYDDIASTFKGLVALIFVVVGLTMIALAIWGK